MGKTISIALENHLARETTSMAYCWHLIRRDGVQFGFTTHDQDILYAGLIYKAETGFIPTSADTSLDLNVDDMEIEGVFDSVEITEQAMLAGKWDYAEVRAFMINWQDTGMDIVRLRRGWLGELSKKRASFIAELRGLAQKIQQPIGRVLTPGCTAEFGDPRCGVDVAPYTVTDSVATVGTSNRIFSPTGSIDLGNPDYVFGRFEWMTGDNVGIVSQIRGTDPATGTLALFLPMPYPIVVGDSFSATFGCVKSKEHCKRYNNLVNFRGFPDIPHSDEAIEGPDC